LKIGSKGRAALQLRRSRSHEAQASKCRSTQEKTYRVFETQQENVPFSHFFFINENFSYFCGINKTKQSLHFETFSEHTEPFSEP